MGVGGWKILHRAKPTDHDIEKIIIMKTKLSKIFSREKGIWYAYLWDESDRMGFKKYLGYEVENNLFIRKDGKLFIWYSDNETEIIHQKIKDKFLHDKNFVNKIFEDLNCEWKYISPHIERGVQIKNIEELREYYNHLVKWWSAMNILFRLGLTEDLVESVLEYRKKAEKFSDAMIDVWDEFWSKKSKLNKIMNLVTPKEAFFMDNLSQQEISAIMDRENGVALFNSVLYPLNQVEDILRENNLELEKEIIEDAFEIKGAVAFKGITRGFVRVILLAKDISKIQQGEILVTDMTRPDYLPAMRKSAAFVTDEGGITCHAAIVARELKKPCIIGTKIATQVLKDGYLVEVDADSGIVRIIKN
ncbi:MAG: hypothetical protein ACD_11C00103G0006 [uncultured bacterium]|nr:MAG: hypothetical protein ACD_11C00103G0006 [uncultured bacterium]HBR71911.1 hypothetical protein [Candidatus Moranbacteria bacterium]